MSEKQYDPQYETNVPHFNRKVVEQWVSENDLEKISHWLKMVGHIKDWLTKPFILLFIKIIQM